MLQNFFRNSLSSTQVYRKPMMREEIVTIQLDEISSFKILLRVVQRDKVTVAVVTPIDLAAGVCNIIEEIEEYICKNYGVKTENLVLIEQDPPIDILPKERFDLVMTAYTMNQFKGHHGKWKEISREEVEQFIGMPLPKHTYAQVPSKRYLTKIASFHHELIRFVNSHVCNLGKVVDLSPDNSWQRNPSEDSFKNLFQPLDFFESKLTYLEIHVTREGLKPGKQLQRQKRNTMTEYLLLDEKAFAEAFCGQVSEAFYNSWSKKWIVNVPQLSKICVDRMLKQEKKMVATLRDPDVFEEQNRFADELTEKDIHELNTTASYCIYGWMYSKPKEEVAPESVFQIE